MADVLAAQDCLYSLVVRNWLGPPVARVVGSIVEYLFAPDDAEAVLTRMTRPETRIVSLTVTEGGYNLDAHTGEFDLSNRQVQADLRRDAPPCTMYGLLAEALRRRRTAGVAPFAVMSCDNVVHNGSVARRSVCGFAEAFDPEFAGWIAAQVRFPDSMVDRITPATTDADRDRFAQDYGVVDGWPVYCEPFTQWVLQDVLPADARPPLEAVGVQLVDDVGPYEHMKLRLLNAGHQAVGYLGYLAGHRYVHDACADESIAGFLRGYLDEVTPTLLPVPGIALADYKNELVVRFANPGIGDNLARICAYGSDRMPTFVLPALADNVRAGRDVRCAALVVAAWRGYLRGRDEQGVGIDVVDLRRDELVAHARTDDPLVFVSDPALFGSLANDTVFRSAYLDAVNLLESRGARAAAAATLGG
jgi:mannitol 2-dehydrogenase